VIREDEQRGDKSEKTQRRSLRERLFAMALGGLQVAGRLTEADLPVSSSGEASLEEG
jgi:hypothetical protein